MTVRLVSDFRLIPRLMVASVMFLCACTFSSIAQSVITLAQIRAPNATQAVAVDSLFFYAISNSKIVKHNKTDGVVVAEWEGPLRHLNSGTILDGKLYCANSNYPDVPMASSLEIFDAVSLKHIGSRSFGIGPGSLTWIDRYRGDWYLMFVHYENQAQEMNKGVEYSMLVQADSLFRPKQQWILPQSLIERLRPYSVSGGVFDDAGVLYLTPHHQEEIYLCQLPTMGYELKWVGTVTAPIQGQGIARDRTTGEFFGIHRDKREVVRMKFRPE